MIMITLINPNGSHTLISVTERNIRIFICRSVPVIIIITFHSRCIHELLIIHSFLCQSLTGHSNMGDHPTYAFTGAKLYYLNQQL